MIRKNLIEFCRYYKGEEECPKGMKESFWNYEKKWVELSMNSDDLLGNMIYDYIAYGLREFEQMDNTPVSLKSLLFNRYSHFNRIDIDAFKKWYKEEYYG